MIDRFDRHLPRGAEVRSTERIVGRVTGLCSGPPASNGWLPERRPTPGEAIAVALALAARPGPCHGHTIAGRMVTFRPMQKTYLHIVRQTQGVAPLPAPAQPMRKSLDFCIDGL
jgi:hypothetical protein